jgi:hypothetical protein
MTPETEFRIHGAGIGLLVFGGLIYYCISDRATPVALMGLLMVIAMYLAVVSAGREADKDGRDGSGEKVGF